MPIRPSMRSNRAQSLPMPIEVGRGPLPPNSANLPEGATAVTTATVGTGGAEPRHQSQTMQFFEMCASLIGALAR